MTAYEDAVNDCVEKFDRFHRQIKWTNRCQEKVTEAETEFLNAVDEQRAAYEDAVAAFRLMRTLEDTAVKTEVWT